jgi:hypothetical protein
MHVCIHVCMYIYKVIYIHIYIHIYLFIYTYIHMNIYIYLLINPCKYIGSKTPTWCPYRCEGKGGPGEVTVRDLVGDIFTSKDGTR